MTSPAAPSWRETHFAAFVFSAKAAVAAVTAILVCDLFKLPTEGWAAVSAVIVTHPSLHPSVRASLLRVGANIVGALVGAVLSTFLGPTLVSLAVGVLATGLVCHLLGLDEPVRSAYAAVVIVIFNNSANAWRGSLDRVLAVVIGCLAALAIGFLFDKLTSRFAAKPPSSTNEPSNDG